MMRAKLCQTSIMDIKMTENSDCTANGGNDDHYVMKGPARYEYFIFSLKLKNIVVNIAHMTDKPVKLAFADLFLMK